MSSKRLPRRLQDVFARRLAIMSSRRLGRQKKCYTEDVFKASSRRLQYVFSKTNVYWDALRDTEIDIVIQMILEHVLVQIFKIKEMDEKNNF